MKVTAERRMARGGQKWISGNQVICWGGEDGGLDKAGPERMKETWPGAWRCSVKTNEYTQEADSIGVGDCLHVGERRRPG